MMLASNATICFPNQKSGTIALEFIAQTRMDAMLTFF